MPTKFLLTAAALSLATLAAAQTPSTPAAAPAVTAPASPASPAKKALIARVLELQRAGIENLGMSVVAAPVLQVRQQVGRALQQRIPADKREAVAREIEGDVRKYMEETGPVAREKAWKLAPSTLGTMLDERFTEDELKQVVALLESPVNRKFQSMNGDFQRALSEKVMAESRGTVEPKLRALDQAIAKRLGIAPQAAASGAKN
jgi:hypothetical protein